MEPKTKDTIQSIKSPWRLILLFLLPGALIAIAYALLVHPKLTLNISKLLALGVAALFIGMPVLLGIIYYHSKKQLGVYSIRKMISYSKPISLKNYLWLVPVLLIWSIVVFVFGKKIDEFMMTYVFTWIPKWYVLSVDYTTFDKSQLLLSFLSALLVTGLIIPIVEEVYFRGFLLPRMEHMGKWAPIVNACLFSIYHFWSPWQIHTRIIALIPLCYVAYKTKNIKVTIIVHCLLNILGDAASILVLLLK